MIKLDEGYAIDIYDHGYMVGKTSITLDAKTGRDRLVIRTPSYFAELSDAVEWVYKSMVRDEIGKHRKHIDLRQAAADMRAVEQKLHNDLGPIRALEARMVKEAAT